MEIESNKEQADSVTVHGGRVDRLQRQRTVGVHLEREDLTHYDKRIRSPFFERVFISIQR